MEKLKKLLKEKNKSIWEMKKLKKCKAKLKKKNKTWKEKFKKKNKELNRKKIWPENKNNNY